MRIFQEALALEKGYIECFGPMIACKLLSLITGGVRSGHFAYAIELVWTRFSGEKFRIICI